MRLQFSVRTIILVTTIVAVYLGVMISAAHNQRKAVEALRKVGGRVEYNGSPEKLSGIAKYVVRTLGPDWFYSVNGVSLNNLDLPNGSLRPFRNLRAVTWVSLMDTNVTDQDLADLSHLRALKSLELSQSKLISDVGLRTITSHKNLQSIGLNQLYRMTDEGFACIASMPKVERISSSDTAITDKAIESMNNRGPLQLTITRVQVSKKAIEETRCRLPNVKIRDSVVLHNELKQRFAAKLTQVPVVPEDLAAASQ